MKIFLHKLTVSCMFCTMVVCFALAGCQDVVRRVDDKYRPVKEPGSVTVLADRADDLGVPIQIKNLSVDELELKVSSSDNSPVPFVPILEEGVQSGFGRITITPPSSDEPFGNFTAVIDVCSKETGEVYDSYEYTADRYPWRIFDVEGTIYKFEAVYMEHFDTDKTLTHTDNGTCLFTQFDGGEAVSSNSVLTCTDNHVESGRDGTKLTFKHDNEDFTAGGYDYFEIKFRSDANVTSQITLYGSNSFTYSYTTGKCEASGATDFKLANYDDSDSDWVTLGFWKDTDADGGNCLFVEDWVATGGGAAKKATLSFHNDYTYINIDTKSGFGEGAEPVQIDYVFFYKLTDQIKL